MSQVPIEDLPPAVRATIKPGTPMFAAYAKSFEDQYNLPPNSLRSAVFKMTPDTDALSFLQAAALDKKAQKRFPDAPVNPRAVPAHDVPPALRRTGANLIPTAEEERTGKYTPPVDAPKVLNPASPDDFNISPADNFLAGAGKSLADTGRGIKQILGGGPTPEQAADQRALDAPLMNTGAGTAGNITGTLAQTVLPGTALAKGAGAAGAAVNTAKALGVTAPLAVRAAALSPVAQGAVVGAGFNAAQPVATGETRALNTAEGGAAGAAGTALVSGAQALLRPAKQMASTQVAHLADLAEKYGIPLRAAQISSSPWLKWASSGLDALPFGSGKALKAEQVSKFNRTLAQTMGENTDDALKAMTDARANLGSTYDALKGKYDLQLEPWHVDALQDITKGFKRLDVSKGQTDTKQLADLTKVIVNSTDQNGVIDGAAYKALRSKIGNLARSATDTDYQAALKQQQKVLDQAFKSGLSKDDAALIDLTDKQWGNMRTLEQIAPKTADGGFDFSRLPQVLSNRSNANSTNRTAFQYGVGDQTLPDLARLAPIINAGPGNAAPMSPLMRVGKAAIPGAEVAALGYGMYNLNHEEDNPLTSALSDTAKVLLASKLAGAANNSRWFAQGAHPWLQGAANGAVKGGLGQLVNAYVDAAKQRVPLSGFTMGADGMPRMEITGTAADVEPGQ
jgi:hypothetical protein